jgi:glycosyltransferase involved in cell wall biosynthesis
MWLVPSLLILLPLYNDWLSTAQLLTCIREENIRAEVLIVNDGSTEARPLHSAFFRDGLLSAIHILHLKRNIGHQRAIATGLVYAHQNLAPQQIVVMDSDGEDRPEDIKRLLAAATDDNAVVFASRMRRSESAVFRIFYALYRVFHRLATGIPVRVGNFSLLPCAALESLVVSADLWNHYAASVFRTNLRRIEVPCVRGKRFEGRSKMNFISLVVHGFSALSVFADIISVRFLSMTVLAIAVCILAIPLSGGATLVTGLALVLLVQLVMLAIAFCFLIMNRRSEGLFLPLRDCPYFYSRVEEV